MRRSLNQIEHTVRKAVRGCGYDWGVAEDAGRAVRWMQMVGLDGVKKVAEELESTGSFDRQRHRISHHRDYNGLYWSSDSETVSPIVAGPCVGDQVNACAALGEEHSEPLVIRDLCRPALIAGYCGAAAHQAGILVLLSWEGFTMACGATGYRKLGDAENAQIASVEIRAGNDVMPEGLQQDAPCSSGRIGSSDVDDASWLKLEKMAHRTYVEATASSRLSGAGAGLNDND